MPMYFGEVFEPEHWCSDENCGCGHRRFEHKDDRCTVAKIRNRRGNYWRNAGDVRMRGLSAKQIFRDGQKTSHSTHDPSQ